MRRTRVSAAILLLAAAMMGVARPANAAAAAASCLIPQPGTRLPVILVHGFNSSASTWDRTVTELKRIENISVAAFAYGNDPANDRTLSRNWVTDPRIGHELAVQIACTAAASREQGGAGRVFLVGHSMGGLAIRCALDAQCNDGGQGSVPGIANDVAAVVTLGTPSTGSFLRGGQWQSRAQSAAGPVLVKLCQAVDVTTPGHLSGLCDTINALTTSDAAKAFEIDSPQLRALPKVPAAIPVLAVAGRVQVTTSVGPFWSTTLNGDVGDLVVGTDSALAGGNEADGLGGTLVEDCGSLDLSVTAAALGPVGIPLQAANIMSGLTCTHVSQTGDDGFRAHILSQINTYRSMPRTPTELVAYIQAGRNVNLSDYTQYIAEFSTPSGNIHCAIATYREPFVTCYIEEYSFPPATPRHCDFNIVFDPDFISASASGVVRGGCFGGAPFNLGGNRVLPYGSTIVDGSIACRSESLFLACAETSTGNGFILSRTMLRVYGQTSP